MTRTVGLSGPSGLANKRLDDFGAMTLELDGRAWHHLPPPNKDTRAGEKLPAMSPSGTSTSRCWWNHVWPLS